MKMFPPEVWITIITAAKGSALRAIADSCHMGRELVDAAYGPSHPRRFWWLTRNGLLRQRHMTNGIRSCYHLAKRAFKSKNPETIRLIVGSPDKEPYSNEYGLHRNLSEKWKYNHKRAEIYVRGLTSPISRANTHLSFGSLKKSVKYVKWLCGVLAGSEIETESVDLLRLVYLKAPDNYTSDDLDLLRDFFSEANLQYNKYWLYPPEVLPAPPDSCTTISPLRIDTCRRAMELGYVLGPASQWLMKMPIDEYSGLAVRDMLMKFDVMHKLGIRDEIDLPIEVCAAQIVGEIWELVLIKKVKGPNGMRLFRYIRNPSVEDMIVHILLYAAPCVVSWWQENKRNYSIDMNLLVDRMLWYGMPHFKEILEADRI